MTRGWCWLTRERGKITAFARGARRPNSVLLAVSNPFVMGEFLPDPGADLLQSGPGLRAELFHGAGHGPAGGILRLLFSGAGGLLRPGGPGGKGYAESSVLSVKALLNPRLDNHLVRRIYELRIMTINGEYAPEEKGISPETLYVCRYAMTAPAAETVHLYCDSGGTPGTGASGGPAPETCAGPQDEEP